MGRLYLYELLRSMSEHGASDIELHQMCEYMTGDGDFCEQVLDEIQGRIWI